MTCKKCNTALVCRMSNYKGNFENKLQWQNSDGTPHYKWNGPDKFECSIPEGIPTPTPLTKEETASLHQLYWKWCHEYMVRSSQRKTGRNQKHGRTPV